MKTYRFIFPLTLAILLSLESLAQTARLRSANKEFADMNYLNAARIYEDFVREDKRKDPLELKEAMTKLAYCYRRVQDTKNAERVYSSLVNYYADVPSENYLYYAQALAANKKYKESQKMYAKYGEKQANDLRGKRFSVSYMDVNQFYQDSSSYKIEYLPINSRYPDFSPMYYGKGLAFISARTERSSVKRVFSWNQTPFLDIYFHPDTSEIMILPEPQELTASLGGAPLAKDDIATPERKLSKTEIFSRTLNTKYHEGPMTFFQDQKKIIFTRNNDDKGKAGKSNEGIRKLMLYSAEHKGGDKWVNIKELPFNNKDYSCGHPALSPDDSKLYFASDMPGGFGGTDLYVVEHKNGKWGKPVNLGREINTEGNEMFPYVDADGNLYFSSDGHEGLGGLDVFYTELIDDIPVKGVKNVGAPINSEKDDFGFITDKDRNSGYFSSNRKRGNSDDNLYSFRKACKPLNIYVFDSKSKQPIETAEIRIIKSGYNKELYQTGLEGLASMCLEADSEYEFMTMKEGYAASTVWLSTFNSARVPKDGISVFLERSDNSIIKGTVLKEADKKPAEGVQVSLKNTQNQVEKVVTTGRDGGYEFEMKPNSQYTIVTHKDKYTTDTEVINTKKQTDVVEKNVGIYGEGDVFRIENIYYDLNKATIRKDAAKELDKVVALLNKYPQMTIELRSHTDSRAKSDYNLSLSERRAKAAYDYLVKKGIRSMRLTAKGYGETELINKCADGTVCSEADHQLNRRTEFKIMSVQ
jgi:outer membrane protein OmpA-like peptidoglycan-associated protein